MGTSRSPAEFSRKITHLGTVTQRRQKETVAKGALLAKEIIIAEFAARGVSPTSRIAGAKWSVGFDVKGFNTPSALVRVRGPVHLVDGPTKPHDIPKSRRRRAKRLSFPDGNVRSTVHHPGTKGKKAFPAAKAKARLLVPRAMSQSIIAGWRSVL